MRKRNATFAAAIMEWICPPGAPDQSSSLGELQRARISRLLPPIFGIGWLSSLSTLPMRATIGVSDIIGAGVMPIVFAVLCVILCHYKRAYVAAIFYCVAMTIIVLMLAYAANLAHSVSFAIIALFLLLPICGAGSLLGPRACWYIALTISAATLLHAKMDFRSDDVFTIEMLLSCTALLTLGMRGLHTSLTAADRSEELAALNQRLAASLSEIAGREQAALQQRQESQRAHAEMETVFDNVQDALIFFGMDMRPLHINEASRRIFGLTNESADIVAHARSHFQATLLDGTPLPPERFVPTRVLLGEPPLPPRHTRVRRFGGDWVILLTQAVPLNDANGTIIGALNISRDVTTEYFSTRNLQVMQAIGQVCASAAEGVVIAGLALDELLRGLTLTSGAIYLRDDDHPGYARVLAHRSDQVLTEAEALAFIEVLTATLIAADAPIGALRAIATGKPAFYRPDELETTSKFLRGKQQDTVACVPFIVNGAVSGALSFTYDAQRATIWTAADLEVIVAAADEIATSLHRARLYEEARRLALFDPLTGLHNHRALQDSLQRELTLGNSRNLPVSLIMLDIDNFRHFQRKQWA